MANDHLGQMATLLLVYGKWPLFLKWQMATLLLLFMANGHFTEMADGHSYFYGQWPQGMIQSVVMAGTTYKS